MVVNDDDDDANDDDEDDDDGSFIYCLLDPSSRWQSRNRPTTKRQQTQWRQFMG